MESAGRIVVKEIECLIIDGFTVTTYIFMITPFISIITDSTVLLTPLEDSTDMIITDSTQ
jgi:hypothetical protein